MKKFQSEVYKCSCEHAAQDSIHGKGYRVFNRRQNPKFLVPTYRCTVCGREKTNG